MEKALQVFNNENFGEIRGMMINGVPYFVGKDVAAALGYTNPPKAIRDHVDEEDKTVNDLFTVNGTAPILINESGLYSLILASKLPKAKEFKRWATSEVLPSIRKTGAYSVKPVSALTALEQTLNVLKEHEARLQAVEEEQQKQSSMLAWLNPTEGETPRQTLNRLIKEYAMIDPQYKENSRMCHQKAWIDFTSIFNNDQHVDLKRRANNRKCNLMEVLVMDNMLTQAVTVASQMLIKARRKSIKSETSK